MHLTCTNGNVAVVCRNVNWKRFSLVTELMKVRERPPVSANLLHAAAAAAATAATAAKFLTNCFSLKNFAKQIPTAVVAECSAWYRQLRFMHQKKEKRNENTEWPLLSNKRAETQANQFSLFLSTCNTKSISSKQNTAHTIPAVQLWKSNAIIGQLPLSIFPT